MSGEGSGGGAGGGQGTAPIVHQIAFFLSLLGIAFGWPLVWHFIPPDARFTMRDLALEHWQHRNQLEPWLNQRWLWLASNRYHLFFALAALPGALAIGAVQAVDRRTGWPLLAAPLGWGGELSIGLWLYTSFVADSPPLGVMLPAIFAYLGGAVARWRRGSVSGPAGSLICAAPGSMDRSIGCGAY